jgi:Histidine phosphatase superfamily (branch 1)
VLSVGQRGFTSAAGPSRRGVVALLGAAALAGCTMRSQVGLASHINFAPPPASDPAPLVQGTQAVATALARGGYVIYLRHGRTQYDQIEMERANRNNGSFDLAKCETQRQLSDEGRVELEKAGEQFRLAGIPLDGVFSSRYCRAIESAAFFVDGAVATDMLSGEGSVGKDPAQKARTVAFLSQRPAPGRNHFMMAHGGIFWEATGFSVQEAHAVVLDPTNLRVIVARITPEEWGSIAWLRPQ